LLRAIHKSAEPADVRLKKSSDVIRVADRGRWWTVSTNTGILAGDHLLEVLFREDSGFQAC
jgi:hypothetical protein